MPLPLQVFMSVESEETESATYLPYTLGIADFTLRFSLMYYLKSESELMALFIQYFELINAIPSVLLGTLSVYIHRL